MKSLVLLLFFLFLSLVINAQIYIGPRVGISRCQDASMDLLFNNYYDGKVFKEQFNSTNYGIEMIYEKGDYFHFKTDLSYLRAGSKYRNEKVSYLQTRDYIKANLIVAFGFTADDYKLLFQLGYYYSALLKRNTEGAMPQSIDNWRNRRVYSIIENNYQNDFGFSLGASFSLAIGKGWIEVNPRWELGLVSHTTITVRNINSNRIESTAEFRNNVLSLNVSYVYPLFK